MRSSVEILLNVWKGWALSVKWLPTPICLSQTPFKIYFKLTNFKCVIKLYSYTAERRGVLGRTRDFQREAREMS